MRYQNATIRYIMSNSYSTSRLRVKVPPMNINFQMIAEKYFNYPDHGYYQTGLNEYIVHIEVFDIDTFYILIFNLGGIYRYTFVVCGMFVMGVKVWIVSDSRGLY